MKLKKYNGSNKIIYIENCDEGFFQKMKETWNKIVKLIGINYAPDFVKHTLNYEKYIMADIFGNTNFVKSNCHKDEIIIVLHSVVNIIIKASLLEVTENEDYQIFISISLSEIL